MPHPKPSTVVRASARNAIWPLLRRTRYRLTTVLRSNPVHADLLDPLVEALANAEAMLIGRDGELKRRAGRGPRPLDAPLPAEDQLHARIRELERELHEREELLAIVAHDLRTPLSPIMLMAQRLLDEVQRHDVNAIPIDWLRPRVESIAKRLEELVQRLNRLLDVPRMQTGYIGLTSESVDLVAVVHDQVNRARQQAPHADITVAGDATCVGRWDRMRLEQIVGNVLSNAIRHGGSQAIAIKVRRDGDLARLAVRDRGAGIASDDQARIFERYTRLASGGPGLGLGLWIVRELCRAMGGEVAVASDAGAGATFTVTLPVQIRRTEV